MYVCMYVCMCIIMLGRLQTLITPSVMVIGLDLMVIYSSLYLPLTFDTCLCVLFRDTVFASFCYMCSCTYSGIIQIISINVNVLPYKLLNATWILFYYPKYSDEHRQ